MFLTLLQANCERRKHFRGRSLKPLPQWLKWHFAVVFLLHRISSEGVKSVGQSLVKAGALKIGSLSSLPENRHRNIILRAQRKSTKSRKHFWVYPKRWVHFSLAQFYLLVFYFFFCMSVFSCTLPWLCTPTYKLQMLLVCPLWMNPKLLNSLYIITHFYTVHVWACRSPLLHTKSMLNSQLLRSSFAWVSASQFILDE